jgi:hypothetical protein
MSKDWLKDNIRSIISLLVAFTGCFILIFAEVQNVKDSPIVTRSVDVMLFMMGYYYSASKDKMPPTT